MLYHSLGVEISVSQGTIEASEGMANVAYLQRGKSTNGLATQEEFPREFLDPCNIALSDVYFERN